MQPRATRRRAILLTGLVVLAAAGLAWKMWPGRAASGPGTAPAPIPGPAGTGSAALGRRPPPQDPRLTFATPYRNVRPEVRYVGDEACAGCHRRVSRTYHQHPMGRSVAPVAAASPIERYDVAARHPFEAGGFRYLVERRDGRVFHKEIVIDRQGRALASVEAEIRYAVGAGQRGRSYLIERDGYLFESPLTWFPLKGVWDLSPGYHQTNLHFTRPIVAACMFCHVNRAEPVVQTANRYREPVFQGYSIGCERCHGPGELHVQRRRAGEHITPGTEPGVDDDTIVNPSRLEPELREAVCQQCHLEGEQRVLRRGRGYFDYRPGLPLQLFLADFVKPPEQSAEHKFVGAVEQMYVSRCFLKSRGPNPLGCISCHDPHQLPAAEEKVAYYRERCLHCHAPSPPTPLPRSGGEGSKGCSLPIADRRARQPDDSCVACHMPVISSTIAHAAITDHRIRRRPDLSGIPAAAGAWPRPGQAPLVLFHAGTADSRDEEYSRDLGLALMDLTDKQPTAQARDLAARALPLLEAALARDPDDVPAWEARGSALWYVRRPEEALAAYRSGLEREPDHETLLFRAATLATKMRRLDLARALAERAVHINPWRWEYHQVLAAAHAQGHEWRQAADQCRQALALNPADLPTRRVLITCQARLGEKSQAQAEFDIVRAMTPPDQQATLRQWFEQTSR